jgi:hypothetical protein
MRLCMPHPKRQMDHRTQGATTNLKFGCKSSLGVVSYLLLRVRHAQAHQMGHRTQGALGAM